MKTIIWIILGTLILFCALVVGFGYMTTGELFQTAVNTANTAAELTANVIK